MSPSRGTAYQFWSAVEQARLDRGWTQVELAQRAGIPRSTINRLKDSARPPYVATVHKLADAIGIDRDDALRLAGLQPPTPTTAQQADDELEREIQAIANSDELPEGVKRAMIREAHRLADRQRAERERLYAEQAAERREALNGWTNIARGNNTQPT